MRALWPDLSYIRAQLRSDSVEVDSLDQIEFSEQLSATPKLEMPPAIADLVHRTVSAQQIGMNRPEIGDIVLVRTKASLPLAFFLRAQGVRAGSGYRWQGWLVSSEIDYATDKDVLIEPSDGVADPMAGMIQTWNPVTLEIPDVVRVLARLSTYRLSLIEEVANEKAGNLPEQARPGRIAIRSTASGRVVLTGSPLGGNDDPRHEYREIYRELAASLSQTEVRDTVRVNETRNPEKSSWWLGFGWLKPGIAVAATVFCGVVAFKIFIDYGPDTEKPGLVASSPAKPDEKTQEQPPTQVAQVGTQVPLDHSKSTGMSPSAPQQAKNISEKPKHRDSKKQVGQEAAAASDEARKIRPDQSPSGETKENRDSRILIAKSSLLIPLKDSSALVLAMRSGNAETTELGAFEIGIKDVAQVDSAVDFLQKKGFKVIRVDEQAMTIRVLIETKKLGQSLEDELSGTGLFMHKSGGRP